MYSNNNRHDDKRNSNFLCRRLGTLLLCDEVTIRDRPDERFMTRKELMCKNKKDFYSISSRIVQLAGRNEIQIWVLKQCATFLLPERDTHSERICTRFFSFFSLLSLSRLMVLRANCESFISYPQTIQLLRIEEKRKRMLRIFVLHLLFAADTASIHSYVEHLSNGILAAGRRNLILTSIQTYVVSNCCWALIVH